ncbi:MAG: gluconate 2-dehydrogenase subunit 3 family protein [Bacteroidota bacterium]
MQRRTVLQIMGYSLGSAVLTSWLAACQDRPLEPSTSSWHTPAEVQILQELGEVILPKSDTPGARDLGVHQFIDLFVAEVLDGDRQQEWRRGLQAWEQRFSEHIGLAVEQATADQYTEELSRYWSISKEAQNAVRDFLDQPVPTTLVEENRWRAYLWLFEFKKLLLLGYYQSKEVGQEILVYDPVPGGYTPCMEIEPGTKAWSL